MIMGYMTTDAVHTGKYDDGLGLIKAQPKSNTALPGRALEMWQQI